jgi:hypothetical protein
MFVDSVHWSDAQWKTFLDQCFAHWLNRIDAMIDYEQRRSVSLQDWRALFDDGEGERDAIAIAIWGKC